METNFLSYLIKINIPYIVNMPITANPKPKLKEITAAKLNQVLRGQSAEPLVLAFVAPWCPHCQHLMPTLMEAAQKSKVPFFTVTHGKPHFERASEALNVAGFPTVYRIHMKEVRAYSGNRTKPSLIKFAEGK
jgi:thioredoxin-like negative regulator of GroEL